MRGDRLPQLLDGRRRRRVTSTQLLEVVALGNSSAHFFPNNPVPNDSISNQPNQLSNNFITDDPISNQPTVNFELDAPGAEHFFTINGLTTNYSLIWNRCSIRPCVWTC